MLMAEEFMKDEEVLHATLDANVARFGREAGALAQASKCLEMQGSRMSAHG
jgi:hypothetical protein